MSPAERAIMTRLFELSKIAEDTSATARLNGIYCEQHWREELKMEVEASRSQWFIELSLIGRGLARPGLRGGQAEEQKYSKRGQHPDAASALAGVAAPDTRPCMLRRRRRVVKQIRRPDESTIALAGDQRLDQMDSLQTIPDPQRAPAQAPRESAGAPDWQAAHGRVAGAHRARVRGLRLRPQGRGRLQTLEVAVLARRHEHVPRARRRRHQL
ncbi:hypothetical protein ON010_g18562 [Phytophthora cinnamomi]|nr:hypothetical protein ON010_g18562 [Phytophthora cinnamomi]